LKGGGALTTVAVMGALIAFDLDGVIYSSEPFLGEAYREAIAAVNTRRAGSFPRVPTTREILDHVGWPVPVILARLFPAVDDAAVELLYAETLQVICAHVRRGEGLLFPGVAQTLDRLQAADFTLAIASNGRQSYIEAVLQANGIAPQFVERITVDRERMKQKADVLRAYLTRYELPRQRLVMVGDRASDVEAAVAVGCHFIGCDYGHGYRHEIEAAGPMVSAFDQLPEAIDRVLAAS
jgi:phosphoglycolate phosphatase